MRKAAFLLVLLFATSAFAQQSVFFDGDFAAAKVEAQKEGKHILIDFFSYG